MSFAPIVTVDLGSTVTKVVVWTENGPAGIGRAAVPTSVGPGGVVEQDPHDWWDSVVAASASAFSSIDRTSSPDVRAAPGCIVFSAARQTFVGVDRSGAPTGPGIMWSDRRAGKEAAEIAEACGGAKAIQHRTGPVFGSAAPAAKLLWLERNAPDRLGEARWILSPRDFVVLKLTGEVATDASLAQSSGLYDRDLEPVPELSARVADKLPPVVPPAAVVGRSVRDAVPGVIPPGVPVVIGAGDRPCEVLGTAAAADRPMVSWGTTANVSVPVADWPDVNGLGVGVSRGALGGFLAEAGLSSAGSFLSWLSRVTGGGGDSGVASLLEKAASSPPGANGVTAVSWLGGARAPWWRDDARGAFFGLSPEHGPGDLARACVEGVAFDVARCIAAIADVVGIRSVATSMAGGSGLELWPEVLASVTNLRGTRRTSGLAACAGAALIGAQSLDMDVDLDDIDPAGTDVVPDQEAVALYSSLAGVADSAASAVLAVAGAPSP